MPTIGIPRMKPAPIAAARGGRPPNTQPTAFQAEAYALTMARPGEYRTVLARESGVTEAAFLQRLHRYCEVMGVPVPRRPLRAVDGRDHAGKSGPIDPASAYKLASDRPAGTTIGDVALAAGFLPTSFRKAIRRYCAATGKPHPGAGRRPPVVAAPVAVGTPALVPFDPGVYSRTKPKPPKPNLNIDRRVPLTRKMRRAAAERAANLKVDEVRPWEPFSTGFHSPVPREADPGVARRDLVRKGKNEVARVRKQHKAQPLTLNQYRAQQAAFFGAKPVARSAMHEPKGKGKKLVAMTKVTVKVNLKESA